MSKTPKEVPNAVAAFLGSTNTKLNKYESLLPKNDYDQEKAEVLAEAMTELRAIEKRAEYLRELSRENKDLHKHLWTDADGTVKPFHKIDNNHLTNILKLLTVRGSGISKELRTEALARGIEIPEQFSEGLDD